MTAPTTREERTRRRIDRALTTAARDAIDAGAPLGLVIDRALTFAGAHAVMADGSAAAAAAFRHAADAIEAGAFAHIEHGGAAAGGTSH